MTLLPYAKPLALCSLILALAGCGSGSGLPEGDTGTVSGVVKYQDKPVPAGCTVLFTRTDGGYTATGVTNGSGEYTLEMRGGPDILAGTYRVMVSPPAEEKPNLTDEEIMEQSMKNQGKPAEIKPRPFPEKFSSPEETPLSAEVKAGSNEIPLEMKD